MFKLLGLIFLAVDGDFKTSFIWFWHYFFFYTFTTLSFVKLLSKSVDRISKSVKQFFSMLKTGTEEDTHF